MLTKPNGIDLFQTPINSLGIMSGKGSSITPPPPQNISYVAVAWIDETGRLVTHGIGKREPNRPPLFKHWTLEWTLHITEEQSMTLEVSVFDVFC